ncbi:MAG: hypothetical protein ISS62_05690 [Desulfobacteraceae bacterium]|nr:hypothetical protein [Desulfobacteraceae bacterium]
MELMVVVILAFVLFWGGMFLADFILKHIKRPKMMGCLFIFLAVLIGIEFYDKNQLVAGSSIFVAFTGARILMK